MLVLFGLTLFVSGALLFVVEPMFAKMALPKLGGTPAVWNVCMVFYQALLLAGYAYAHELAKRFTPRRAALVQLGIVLAALFALPIRLPDTLNSPFRESPTLWLLMLLVVGVGLPFFVLTTYSSTLQTWYAHLSRTPASEPYVLYRASNLGSMIGLFAYPFLIERHLGLAEQTALWGWGYKFLVALTVSCALTLWFGNEGQVRQVNAKAEMGPPPSRSQELKWLALAFIPSSLMLGVTTALTNELPPIPVLWVLPLAVYLLSFVLVFARKPITYHSTVVETLPILLLVVAFLIASRLVLYPTFSILFYLLTLGFACVACHGELAITRPPAAYLTRFYLCLSIGGVLGGLFNAIVAPLIFKSVAELPLTLFLLALAISGIASRGWRHPINRWDIILPAALGLGFAVAATWFRSSNLKPGPMTYLVVFVPPILICFSFLNRPLRFALGFGSLLLASALYPWDSRRVLVTERSFFGVYRVAEAGQYRELFHGSTIHGIQSMDPTRAREPLSYYYETGPVGQVFRSPSISDNAHNIAVIGLGAGTLACYSAPSRTFTFYEIDPTVEYIARNSHYFTYLQNCSPGATIVIGDARLSLRSAPAHQYDMLFVDAFSSDSIPAHLLTREAIQLYLAKLTDHGLLVFNITNRYLDLKPALGQLAQDAGLVCIVRQDIFASRYEWMRGKYDSTWLLMARERSDFATLASQTNWQDIRVPPGNRVWTDDYSSIVGLIRWF